MGWGPVTSCMMYLTIATRFVLIVMGWGPVISCMMYLTIATRLVLIVMGWGPVTSCMMYLKKHFHVKKTIEASKQSINHM